MLICNNCYLSLEIKGVFVLFVCFCRATDDNDNSVTSATCTVAITDVAPTWSGDATPYCIKVSKDIAASMYFFVYSFFILGCTVIFNNLLVQPRRSLILLHLSLIFLCLTSNM